MSSQALFYLLLLLFSPWSWNTTKAYMSFLVWSKLHLCDQQTKPLFLLLFDADKNFIVPRVQAGQERGGRWVMCWKRPVRISCLSFPMPLAKELSQLLSILPQKCKLERKRETGKERQRETSLSITDVCVCQTHGPQALCLVFLAHVSLTVWHAHTRCTVSFWSFKKVHFCHS